MKEEFFFRILLMKKTGVVEPMWSRILPMKKIGVGRADGAGLVGLEFCQSKKVNGKTGQI